MTTKQLLKLVGKTLKIEMQIFPHSVVRKVISGKLEAVAGNHAIARNGRIQTFSHVDFYIFQDEGKAILIEWNEVKLITKVEIL